LRATIDIGRIEEVDAGVEGFVHDRKAGGLIGKLAEIHGTERQPADLQACPAQMSIVHWMTPDVVEPITLGIDQARSRRCTDHDERRLFTVGLQGFTAAAAS
jgi:hypothetical protein